MEPCRGLTLVTPTTAILEQKTKSLCGELCIAPISRIKFHDKKNHCVHVPEGHNIVRMNHKNSTSPVGGLTLVTPPQQSWNKNGIAMRRIVHCSHITNQIPWRKNHCIHVLERHNIVRMNHQNSRTKTLHSCPRGT